MPLLGVCLQAQLKITLISVVSPKVINGHISYPSIMSAFGGKADVNHCVGECPLLAEAVEKLPVASGLNA